jgi:arylsulfatase A-like enzyme
MKPSTPRWYAGLPLALGLAMVLLLISYSRVIGDSQTMLFRSKVLDSVFAGPIWGTALSYNLVFLALAMILTHSLYAAAFWAAARASLRAWPSLKATPNQHLLLWFVVFTVGLLAHNAAVYSTSSLGEPYAELMTQVFLGTPLGQWIWFGVLTAVAGTVLVAAWRWWQAGGRVSRKWVAGFALAFGSWAGLSAFARFHLPPPVDPARPNIILIGMDSLRADLVDEEYSPHLTPNTEAFMKGAMRFTNAYTPLARTFPSMVTMLTGRHPHHTGAIMNLLPRALIDDSESLPRALSRAGYETVYSMDEVRFANIDTSYGFDQTITPPIGASEFLIELLVDTPLSNLVINTRLGGWLFPHAHGNRAVSASYDPDTFVERIDRELRPTRPLFLTVHLTLDHWPYSWAGVRALKNAEKTRWPLYYLAAANRVDQQMGDILAVLLKKGLLQNAIVIVYSDHGESFNAPDQMVAADDNPLLEEMGLSKPVWGHGTAVLVLGQYHIILGARRFGGGSMKTGTTAAPVSFEDITPTILDMLGLQAPARIDGHSLLPLIEGRDGAEQAFANRIRFIETEYRMPLGLATQDGKVDAEKIREAMRVYNIDRETDRVTVRKELLSELLKEREYAAIGSNYLLGAFPNYEGPGFRYLAARLQDGALRYLPGPPPPQETELRALWDAMQARFGTVLANRPAVAIIPVAKPDLTVPSSVTK